MKFWGFWRYLCAVFEGLDEDELAVARVDELAAGWRQHGAAVRLYDDDLARLEGVAEVAAQQRLVVLVVAVALDQLVLALDARTDHKLNLRTKPAGCD